MTIAELLAEEFGRIHGVVLGAVRGLSEEELAFRPEGRCNSIAWLVWHLTRIQDDHVADVAGTQQAWTAEGWADRFALPFPVAETGYGHSSAEVAAVRASADLLVGYHEAVSGHTVEYVRGLADADLDRAVPGTVDGIFRNQGEVCLAGSRLYVQRPIYDEFCARYVAAAQNLVVGDPREPATQVGPLVSREHLDKVLSYIRLGEQEGAKLLTGGQQLTAGALAEGNYVAPTVFADVENSWRISQEEIFGPVQVIAPFDDVDQAIALANDSRYGLAGMIWTTSLDTAHKVAREVRTGTMWVNCFFVRDLRAPFGGMKDSGIGREGGLHSEEFFTEAKAVVLQFPS